jgi:hypothetical protein
MKKALLYVATAILLGTVTMVAPLMLLKPRYFEAITQGSPASSETLDKGEGRSGEVGALETAISPRNLRSAGLIFIPGFLLALGFSLYVKKRMYS